MKNAAYQSPKMTKREKLYQRQVEFVIRGHSGTSVPQYDALKDQHSLQYFLKNPIKKNLKRYLKAVNLQPFTQQNSQTIKSLNQLLTLNTSSSKKQQQTASSILLRRKKISITQQNYTEKSQPALNYITKKNFLNPYIDALKVSLYQKRNKARLQSLKKGERSFKQRLLNQKKYEEKKKTLQNLLPKQVEDNHQQIRRKIQIHSKDELNRNRHYLSSETFLKFINEKKIKIYQRQELQDLNIQKT